MVTDHKPLTTLMSQDVLSRVQTRWIRLGFFQSINPKIQYTPGKANIVADALSHSRRHNPDTWHSSQTSEAAHSDTEQPNGFAIHLISMMTRSSIVPTEALRSWREAQQADPVLRDIIKRVQTHTKRDVFRLDAQGLLIRVESDHTKLMVPSSLW